MKNRMVENWIQVGFALAVAVVGWTVLAAQNVAGTVTLEADADWRSEVVTFEEGAVLNLGGHKLWLGNSGCSAATILDETGVGELHVEIAEGTTQESLLVLAGSAKLIKEGAGTYVQKAVNTATGEVVVASGLLRTGIAGAYPKGVKVVVENGAAFDVAGFASDLEYQIEGVGPDGKGALRNSGANIGERVAQMEGLTLTGDATIYLQGDFGMVSEGFAPNELRLGGHTLTLACDNGKAFWFRKTTCPDTGVIRAIGCTPFVAGDGCWLPNVDMFLTGAQLWLRPDSVLRSLTVYGASGKIYLQSGKLSLENLTIHDACEFTATGNPICAKGTVLVSNETANVVVSIPIIGRDGQRPTLVKQGAGTLTLTAANQFGSVDILAGTVVAGGNAPQFAFSNVPVAMNVADGAKLDLSGCGSGMASLSDLTVAAGGEVVGAEVSTLLHRWSFDDFTDSVGGSTAVLEGDGAELRDGKLVLNDGSGGNTGYALLGTGLLPASGPFTIEFWAQQDNIVSWSRMIDIGTTSGQSFMMAWTRSTNINQDQAENGGKYLLDTMAPYTLGTMFHIAVTCDGAGNIAWSKRNLATGEYLKGSALANNGTDWLSSGAKFHLGKDIHTSGAAGMASATYDEVRIWKGVLSDPQLTAHAYAGPGDCSRTEVRVPNPVVPVEEPELLHRWSFNGNLTDSVGSSTAVLTGEGAEVVDNQLVLHGGPGYALLGTGTLPATGPFTIEVWARQDAIVNWSRVFDIGTTGGKSFAVAWTRGTNINQDQIENGGKYLQETMAPYTLGTMYHISVTCDGAGWIRWTKRNAATGVVEKNMCFANSGGDWTQSTARFHLGKDLYSLDSGSVASATYDEVRIWKGVLSEARLTQSAKNGPDASCLLVGSESDSTLAHRWSFTADMTDSVGGRTGILNGAGARVENGMLRLTGGPKDSSWAELGVGLLPPNRPFTIELFARKTADQQNSRFLDIGTGQKNSFVMTWYSSSIVEFVEYNGTQYSKTMGAYTVNNFYHIAVVYDGNGTFRWERRNLATGRLERSTSVQGAPQHCTLSNARFWLGHSWYADLDSSTDYDEVRIWDGALTGAELDRSALNGPDAELVSTPVRGGGMKVTHQADLAGGFAFTGALDFKEALTIEVANAKDFANRSLLEVSEGALDNLKKLTVAFAGRTSGQFVVGAAGELTNADLKDITLEVTMKGVAQDGWMLRRVDDQVVLMKEYFIIYVR